MDLLGTMLLSLEVTESSIVSFELAPPWGYSMLARDRDFPIIFSPVDQPCWLTVADQPAVCIQPGDSVLILGAVSSVTQSALDAPVQPLPAAWQGQGLPELGRPSAPQRPVHFRWRPLSEPSAPVQRILALGVAVRNAERHPVLSLLPDLVLLRRSAGALFPWLPTVMQFLLQEDLASTPGYGVTARHLATLVFTSLVRAHVVTAGTARASWLRGLSDPKIGQALALMHQRPGEAWTLAALAGACGMSRTGFARRFAALVGTTPIAHLTGVRMVEAARRLQAGTPVGIVVGDVGYASDWAFRRAFVQHHGMTPLRFAKGGAAAPADGTGPGRQAGAAPRPGRQ